MNEIDHLKELVNEKFAARDKAVERASNTMEQRLEHMNEFREQLSQQAGTFITRTDHEVLIRSIANMQKYMWMVLGAGFVVGTVLQIFFFVWNALPAQHADQDVVTAIEHQLQDHIQGSKQ